MVWIVVLEKVRRTRLVVVVRILVVIARLVVVVVRVLRVLRVIVTSSFIDFCLFIFYMHRYFSSLILRLRFLRATNKTLLLFLFISSAVRFN